MIREDANNVRVLRPWLGAALMTSSGTGRDNQISRAGEESDRQEIFDLALDAVKRAPDIRAERVAELRRRIQAGDYHVPDHLLAEKILAFCA